ncbi:glycoside hydrolase family 27 protein [bacterium]|nr:glycoside hydrolase family 27 protein [bacterium]
MRSNKACVIMMVVALFASGGPAGEQTPAIATDRTAAMEDGLAMTPPMGWYPWNQFGQEPQNETLIKQMADALIASGMHEAGYAYLGPDEGICFYRDANGLLTTNLKRYPAGLRGLGDYIHRKGLKYALYTDAGTFTCSKAMPGTKDHESDDMRLFAEWRCDYLKIDWCNTEGQDIVKSYTVLRKAQRETGRPIVHSLCSWGVGEPWNWAAAIGHMWRTTQDICGPGQADWNKAMKIALDNQALYPHAGPGYWNDPDMMIAGMDGLSEAQNRSFFSLWCIMAAPLMAGNDLRSMTTSTATILTNIEAIAINQDPLGKQGHIIRTDGAISVWAGKPLFDGGQAVLVFNQGTAPSEARVTWQELGFDANAALYARDLWTHRTTGPLTGGITMTVPPSDVVMLRVSAENKFPIPPIISADSYLMTFSTNGSSSRKLTQTIRITDRGTNLLPAWRVTSKLPGWLAITVEKDGHAQKVTGTVSTSGLKKGPHHALIRLDNNEPVSGRPLTAFYFDVDVDVH